MLVLLLVAVSPILVECSQSQRQVIEQQAAAVERQSQAAKRQAEAAERHAEAHQRQMEQKAEAAERQREAAERQAERKAEAAERQAERQQRRREQQMAAAERQKEKEKRIKEEAAQRQSQSPAASIVGNSLGDPGHHGGNHGSSNWPRNFNNAGVGAGNFIDGSAKAGNGIGVGNVLGGSTDNLGNGNSNVGVDGNDVSFINGHTFINGPSQTVWGNGQLGTVDRPVEPFSGVSMSGSIVLELSQSTPTGKVRLRGETNILPLFEAVVLPSGILTIRLKPNVSFFAQFPIKAYASSKSLRLLEAGGSAEIRMATALRENMVTVNGMGSAKIQIPSGRVETLSVDAQGSGEIHAFGLDAGRASVKAAGSGRVQVTASKYLTAMASGSANIVYRGTAQLGPTQATGSSSISRAN